MTDTSKKEKKMSKSAQYDLGSGAIKRKARFCPKCGPGVFMGEHKDRSACGKCGYTEMKKK